MKNLIKYLLVFVAGIAIAYFIFNYTKNETKTDASHTIAYGIERLNKLVVAEQNYTNFYSHKSKTSFLGDMLSFNKNLLLKVDIRAQASYDLSQMEVEIDSANQTIIIRKIPEVKIETFPDVEFFEMNQSVMNQFSSDDLNAVKKRAVQEVEKTVDNTDLKKQANEQLLENLEEIYILAKIYGWKIDDQTPYSRTLNERVRL